MHGSFAFGQPPSDTLCSRRSAAVDGTIVAFSPDHNDELSAPYQAVIGRARKMHGVQSGAHLVGSPPGRIYQEGWSMSGRGDQWKERVASAVDELRSDLIGASRAIH